MYPNNLHEFILYCKDIQPQTQEDIKRFFEGVVGFPYDQELLLQAFIFLNLNKYFPVCTDLLLFKKSPIWDYTNLGKCDFVYLTTQNSLFLIETKFIDTQATGSTERTRRNKHRNKHRNTAELAPLFGVSRQWKPIKVGFEGKSITHNSDRIAIVWSLLPSISARAIAFLNLFHWR